MGGQFLKNLDVAERTDVGLVRHKNEDTSRILIPPSDSPQEKWGALFLVVDGMGGLGGGDVASQFAVEEIARHYYSDEGSIEETQTFESSTRLHKALQAASEIVRDQAPRLGLPRIGATAAGIALSPSGDVVIFNVGDCRVYRLRKGAIERVSHDQSVMERQIEAGLAPEYSAQATRSSMVTAFLGQPIPLQPNLRKDKVEPGDVYVVCSDGLWSLVDAKEIARIVKTGPAEIAAQKLIKLALKRGGHDNVTVIVLRIGGAPSRLGGFVRRLVAALVFAVILTVGAIMLKMVIAPGRVPPAISITASALVVTATRGAAAVTSAARIVTTAPAAGTAVARTATTASTVNTASTVAAAALAALPITSSPTPQPSPTASGTPLATSTPSQAASPTQTTAQTSTSTSTDTVEPTLGVRQATAGLTVNPGVGAGPTVTLNPYVASYTPTPRPTRTPTLTPTPTPAIGSYQVTGTIPVKIYNMPYADAYVSGTLQPGDVIAVIAVVQGGAVQGRDSTMWLKIVYKGAYRFIHSSYAEFIGGTPTPEPITLNCLPV